MFMFQAECDIQDLTVTGVQTCALPISRDSAGKDWERYRLSEEQVEFFRENGYLKGVRVLSDEQVEALRGELEQLMNPAQERSEEHTSELQSQSNLVCRLLLEKKKRV